MKKDGAYRFNLQFPADTKERIRVGELLEKLGKRKSILVIAAINDYLDRYPQWETAEVRIKIEQQSTLNRQQLENIVREMVEERLGSLSAIHEKPEVSQIEEIDQDISEMVDNLDLFL